MASVLKHGGKTLASLQATLPLHGIHPPTVCLQCHSLKALHTRSSGHRQLFNHRPYSQQRAGQLPRVKYDRTNLHANAPKGFGAMPAGIAAAAFDPLQTEIAMATTVDGLFGAVRANRSLLELDHVLSIFKKLKAVVEVESCPHKQQEIVDLVRQHPEFWNLCSVAHGKVTDMTNEDLADTMESIVQFLCPGIQSSSPWIRGIPGAYWQNLDKPDAYREPTLLVKAIFTEGSHRMHTFDLQQMAKFALFNKCLHPDLRCAPQLGAITEWLSQRLDDIDVTQLPELLALMTATVDISPAEMQNRVLEKVSNLLSEALQRKDVYLTGHDIVCILSYKWKAYRNGSYLELNDLCCQELQKLKEDMPVVDLHKANMILYDLDDFDRPIQFVEELNSEMSRRLPSLDNAGDIGLALENLSISCFSDPSLKYVIEEKAQELLDQFDDVPFSSVCIALRRSKYFHPNNLLVHKLVARIKDNKTNLFPSDIVNIVEYFMLFPELTADILDMYDSVLQRLYECRNVALSPSMHVNILYCMSVMPEEVIRDADLQLGKCEDLLVQLGDRYINLLSFTLQRLKSKLKDNEEKQNSIQDLLEKVNFHAVCNIEQNKSIYHLNSLSRYILNEGQGDVVFLDKVMKQYTQKLDQVSNPRTAVKCAQVLYKAGYLHVPLLDKIAEVVMNNINKVRPLEVTSLIAPFCHLGYHDPPYADEFFDACIDRLIPFLDEVQSGNKPNAFYLVALASYLSYAGRYPEALLKRIFIVEFLDRFDTALQETAAEGKMYLVGEFRRRMMHLNRTVVLECPELQVPWFHEEHCYNMIQRRTANLGPVHRELQSTLVEVLGGAQYLRSLVVCPYFVEVLFEFVVDPNGYLLAIAEYDSLLNLGNSNRVMSDLMQWGTTKSLPKGSQRVVVDYMQPHFYNINSSSLLGGYILKKRQLEIMGYKYIQVPYYEWKSSSLPEKADRVEYLQKLLFSNKWALSGPITVLRDETKAHVPSQKRYHQRDISQRAVVLPGHKSLGGVDLRVREEDMVNDPTLMRVLRKMTRSSEGQKI